MQIFALTIFLPCFLLALHLSNHPRLGALRRTALNPLLLVALFVALAAADFASIAATGYGKLGRHVVRTAPDALGILAAEHAGLILAVLLGVTFILHRPVKATRTINVLSADLRLVTTGLFLLCLLVWFTWITTYSGDYFSFEGGVQIKFDSAGDPVSYTTSLLLLPALCYALCRQPFRVAVPLLLITLVLVLFSGSRTRIIYALVPFFFYLVIVRRINIPRHWFLTGLLVLGALSVVALNLRFLVSFNREVSTEQVLSFTNPLNTPDVAVAETSIIMPRLEKNRITPYPGENLVGMLTAPLPRSVVPFKPLAGSVQFTATYDPERWRSSNSGLVIGVINELRYDYPYPIALVIAFFFGAGWTAALLASLRSRTIHGFVWIVLLYLSVYNFFRNDLLLVGGPLWVTAAYALLIELYRRFKIGSAVRPDRQSFAGMPSQK